MAITAFDAINDALEHCSDLGFEMVPGFATHWAMGSETLIALGHPEAVHDWVAIYRTTREHYPRPEPVEAIDGADESSWRAARGDFDRSGDWQLFFERELAEQPWQDVLVAWWPRLMPGVAAGLTHGLIRVTHAVRGIERSGRPPTDLQLRELATGLSYWAGRYVEQPGAATLFGDARLPDIIADIPRLAPGSGISLRNKGLFLHMGDIAGWDTTVTRLTAPEDVQSGLSDLTQSFVQVFLAHPNQFPVPMIHTVTAPAALRLMLRYLPEELHLPSFVSMWKCNAALLATFAREAPEETGSAAPDDAQSTLTPTELAERAAEHAEDHAMKFAEACLREYALRPDPRYLLAPERTLAKLPDYYGPTRRRAGRASQVS